jgi:hypothetical protein
VSGDTNYVYVDVDRPVIHVYDGHGHVPAVMFVPPGQRERDTDRVVDGWRERYDAACAYAAEQARELDCDWGTNE